MKNFAVRLSPITSLMDISNISVCKAVLAGFVAGTVAIASQPLLLGQITDNETTAGVGNLVNTVATAQQEPGSVDKQLQTAIDSITEAKVKQTVSYLASDELAGRATMSEGFEKAADFVAKRFEDAGLKPVNGDSFFSITELPTTATPKDGLSVKIGTKEIADAELLCGGPEKIEGTFEFHPAELRDSFDEDFSGVAVIEIDKDAGGRRWLAQLARLANRIGRAGGTALFIKAQDDAQVFELVRDLQRPQNKDPRLTFMIPVVVVPAATVTENQSVTLAAPKQLEAIGKAKNVLAMLPGSDPELSKEFILFSAHLDHLPPRDSGDDRIFNGADDNATGVTAVICLAEAFAKLETAPKRTVLFMTFWGEESGLLGSKAFAENPDVELQQIKANINIEMIGRPEAGAREKVWVTGWEKSDLGQLMVAGAAEVGVEIFEHPQFSAMLYQRSDNFSLAAKGVIAHSFSAGSLHADYHQTSDEWEKLDLEHMKSVITGLLAGSYPIANGDVTPKAAE